MSKTQATPGTFQCTHSDVCGHFYKADRCGHCVQNFKAKDPDRNYFIKKYQSKKIEEV